MKGLSGYRLGVWVSLLLAVWGASVSRSWSADVLVPTGSFWRYFDNGIDLGSLWVSPSFDDNAWAQGPAQLGYGDGDEATVVGFGPDPSNRYITTYFRHSFAVTNTAGISNL